MAVPSREYQEYLARSRTRHGAQFDTSTLDAAAHFAPHFGGPRVKVRTVHPGGEVHERTGVVSASMGYRPSFMLVGRSSARGSSDLLGPKDKVVAVKRGSQYVPTSTGSATPHLDSVFNDRRAGT